jgi:hypothetical protein
LKLGLKPKGYLRITLMEENKKATIEAVSDDPINRLTGIFKDYTKFSTKELLKSRKEDIKIEEKKFT